MESQEKQLNSDTNRLYLLAKEERMNKEAEEYRKQFWRVKESDLPPSQRGPSKKKRRPRKAPPGPKIKLKGLLEEALR